MMNRRMGIAVAALGLLALGSTSRAEAKQVFRFQAEWRQDPTVECGPQKLLSLVSSQADVGVVSFSYFNILNTCTGEGFQFVSGSGTVDISGNLNHLSVSGEISANGQPVTIDLDLNKLGKADSSNGDRTVSATAQGEVILNGQDVTGGQPSTTASITRSKS
jgi:hypothetical protein